MFYVYSIFNVINGKIYIGKTQTPDLRWKDHLRIVKGGPEKYKNKYQLIHKAIAKYGINNFVFIILGCFSLEIESNLAEIYWIEFYKSYVGKYGNEFGYNLTKGGEGISGIHLSEEHKNKISFSKIGKIPSDEVIHRLKTMNIGRVHSKETIENTRTAILNFSLVKKIRELYNDGWLQKDLALKFGVKPNTISQIVNYKTWKNI